MVSKKILNWLCVRLLVCVFRCCSSAPHHNTMFGLKPPNRRVCKVSLLSPLLPPSLVIVLVYLTITCGAAASTASVAIIVKSVKVIRQSLSRTIAANFQSPSMAADSSSSRILSVITFISFKMRLSSLGTPLG